MFLLAVWSSRKHLRQVARKIIFNDSSIDDSHEPMRYRTAFLMMLIGAVYIFIFCYAAGMSIWVIVLYFGIYYAISIAITRIRAELGPPTHGIVHMNSGYIMEDFFGTRRIGANNLTIFTFFWWFSGRDYRCHIMPHQLESFKMAQRAGMDNKRLVPVMILGVIIGALSSFWALLYWSYKVGMNAMPIGHAGEFGLLQYQLNNLSGTNIGNVESMIGSFIFTLFLMYMRMRFLWWPFHPAGYALAITPSGIDYIWSCLVLSSLIKFVILKYGGLKMHRKSIPLFFGIILGEFCVGGFWSGLGAVLHIPTYDFYFG